MVVNTDGGVLTYLTGHHVLSEGLLHISTVALCCASEWIAVSEFTLSLRTVGGTACALVSLARGKGEIRGMLSQAERP